MSYDCLNCPGYCCTYPAIEVKLRDINRIAKHFNMSVRAAKKKFVTRDEYWKMDVLKHKKDPIYPTVCQFMHRNSRVCTIYLDRPDVCRQFPGSKSYCGFYAFLQWERRHQKDETAAISAFLV